MQSEAHQPNTESDVGYGRPFNGTERDEELFVDRLQEDDIKITLSDQLGELSTVAQKKCFHQPFQRVVTAEEEQELRLGPSGNVRRLRKDRAVEENQQAEPEQLHHNFEKIITAEGHFAHEAEA